MGGGAAASIVGASFPVSEALVDYPLATGQMIRYAAGAVILTVLAKGRLGRPTARELGLLALVAAIGMAAFNLAVLGAVEHIGATNTGVIIGASPVILALTGRTRDRRLITAAAIVVAGAAIVNGADARISALGTVIALSGLGCEVGFTLLAAPLLPRLGPIRVAAWAAILATLELALLDKGRRPHPHPPAGRRHRLPRGHHHRARLRPLVRRRPATRCGTSRAAGRPDADRGRRRRRGPQRRSAVHRGPRGDGAGGRGCRLRG